MTYRKLNRYQASRGKKKQKKKQKNKPKQERILVFLGIDTIWHRI